MFIRAAENGDLGELQKLLAQGADPRFNHSEALVAAIKGGWQAKNIQCVQYLLDHCDPSAQDFLALRSAISSCEPALISLLLPSFTGFSKPELLAKSLRQVVRLGHTEAFDLFLPLCNPTLLRDPLLAAIFSDQRDFAEQLLQRMDASDLQDNDFLEAIEESRTRLTGSSLDIANMALSVAESLILQEQTRHIPVNRAKTSKKTL